MILVNENPYDSNRHFASTAERVTASVPADMGDLQSRIDGFEPDYDISLSASYTRPSFKRNQRLAFGLLYWT